MPDAQEITRLAKSNLAFALKILPKEQREDMVTFYAFCRTMDDLADEPDLPVHERAECLESWHQGISHGFPNPQPLQAALIDLIDRHNIPRPLLLAIIEGCRSDLEPQRFATWSDLEGYIWKVACAVGLVSIRLFGCHDPASEAYAISLGKALQLTNILRDVREDFDNGGRIYLPIDEMERFGYSVDDLSARVHDERFLGLMEFQATRADHLFRSAAAELPAGDHAALRPARIMADIYHHLLDTMRHGGFNVFQHRYRVSTTRKLMILARHMVD